MKKSGLKSCPFCGGESELLIIPPDNDREKTTWLVRCIKGCCNQMPHKTDTEAIEAWNRRAI